MHIPAGPRRKIINAIAHFTGATPIKSPWVPQDYKPFTVIKNLLSPEEAELTRAFYANNDPTDFSLNGTDYSAMVLGKRLVLPKLEARLKELYPDMVVFNSHYFAGKQEGATYSGWHTGVNLSKLFVGYPETFSVWVPLQTLTEQTGGRLWFYNGEYLDSVIDLLSVTEKKTMVFQYLMLGLLEKELEENKVTADCQFGDAFHFWEWNPHCVDTLCKIPREVVSFRLIRKDAVIDQAFFDLICNHPEGQLDNNLEEKKHFNSLVKLLTLFKSQYEQTVALKKFEEANAEPK